MQIDYDPEADAIYIRLRDEEVDDTREISKYIYVDVDKDGIPVGLEILFASRLLSGEDVTSETLNIAYSPQAAG